MRQLLFITLMIAGCAASDDDTDELETAPEVEDSVPVASQQAVAAEPGVCAMLPDDGSACAHACDSDALKAFIPAGVCVVLDCPLSDGTTYRTGGCNL